MKYIIVSLVLLLSCIVWYLLSIGNLYHDYGKVMIAAIWKQCWIPIIGIVITSILFYISIHKYK